MGTVSMSSMSLVCVCVRWQILYFRNKSEPRGFVKRNAELSELSKLSELCIHFASFLHSSFIQSSGRFMAPLLEYSICQNVRINSRIHFSEFVQKRADLMLIDKDTI